MSKLYLVRLATRDVSKLSLSVSDSRSFDLQLTGNQIYFRVKFSLYDFICLFIGFLLFSFCFVEKESLVKFYPRQSQRSSVARDLVGER